MWFLGGAIRSLLEATVQSCLPTKPPHWGAGVERLPLHLLLGHSLLSLWWDLLCHLQRRCCLQNKTKPQMGLTCPPYLSTIPDSFSKTPFFHTLDPVLPLSLTEPSFPRAFAQVGPANFHPAKSSCTISRLFKLCLPQMYVPNNYKSELIFLVWVFHCIKLAMILELVILN